MGQEVTPASGQGGSAPALNVQGVQSAKAAEMDFYAKLEVQTGFAKEAIAVMKKTVAQGTTDTELAFFLMAAKQQGLDPVRKEIWCIKNGSNGQLLIFASRDGLLKKAQLTPFYNGYRSGVVRQADEFALDIPNGKVHHVITKARNERGPIVGAYYIGFQYDRKEKRDMEPVIVWAQWETFNMNRGPWKTHPDEMMLARVESHGAKKHGAISGLEVEEDFYVSEGVAYPGTPEQGRVISDEQLEDRALREQLVNIFAEFTGKMPSSTLEQFRGEAQRVGQAGGLTSAFVEDLRARIAAAVPQQERPVAVEEVEATVVTDKGDGTGAAQ